MTSKEADFDIASFYRRAFQRHGQGFFAFTKETHEMLDFSSSANQLLAKLREKNVDLKTVVVVRLPLARWQYQA